jgi:hypothetical protein
MDDLQQRIQLFENTLRQQGYNDDQINSYKQQFGIPQVQQTALPVGQQLLQAPFHAAESMAPQTLNLVGQALDYVPDRIFGAQPDSIFRVLQQGMQHVAQDWQQRVNQNYGGNPEQIYTNPIAKIEHGVVSALPIMAASAAAPEVTLPALFASSAEQAHQEMPPNQSNGLYPEAFGLVNTVAPGILGKVTRGVLASNVVPDTLKAKLLEAGKAALADAVTMGAQGALNKTLEGASGINPNVTASDIGKEGLENALVGAVLGAGTVGAKTLKERLAKNQQNATSGAQLSPEDAAKLHAQFSLLHNENYDNLSPENQQLVQQAYTNWTDNPDEIAQNFAKYKDIIPLVMDLNKVYNKDNQQIPDVIKEAMPYTMHSGDLPKIDLTKPGNNQSQEPIMNGNFEVYHKDNFTQLLDRPNKLVMTLVKDNDGKVKTYVLQDLTEIDPKTGTYPILHETSDVADINKVYTDTVNARQQEAVNQAAQPEPTETSQEAQPVPEAPPVQEAQSEPETSQEAHPEQVSDYPNIPKSYHMPIEKVRAGQLEDTIHDGSIPEGFIPVKVLDRNESGTEVFYDPQTQKYFQTEVEPGQRRAIVGITDESPTLSSQEFSEPLHDTDIINQITSTMSGEKIPGLQLVGRNLNHESNSGISIDIYKDPNSPEPTFFAVQNVPGKPYEVIGYGKTAEEVLRNTQPILDRLEENAKLSSMAAPTQPEATTSTEPETTQPTETPSIKTQPTNFETIEDRINATPYKESIPGTQYVARAYSETNKDYFVDIRKDTKTNQYYAIFNQPGKSQEIIGQDKSATELLKKFKYYADRRLDAKESYQKLQNPTEQNLQSNRVQNPTASEKKSPIEETNVVNQKLPETSPEINIHNVEKQSVEEPNNEANSNTTNRKTLKITPEQKQAIDNITTVDKESTPIDVQQNPEVGKNPEVASSEPKLQEKQGTVTKSENTAEPIPNTFVKNPQLTPDELITYNKLKANIVNHNLFETFKNQTTDNDIHTIAKVLGETDNLKAKEDAVKEARYESPQDYPAKRDELQTYKEQLKQRFFDAVTKNQTIQPQIKPTISKKELTHPTEQTISQLQDDLATGKMTVPQVLDMVQKVPEDIKPVLQEQAKRDIQNGNVVYYQNSISQKLTNWLRQTLGDLTPAKIEFVNFDNISDKLKSLGFTDKDILEAIGRHDQTIPADLALKAYLQKVRGVNIILSNSNAPLIWLRAGLKDAEAKRTALHEVFETLVNSGYFTPKEITTLKKAFSNGKEHWMEQAADAFADKIMEPNQTGIFKKIANFFERVNNAINGLGFNNADDIFEAIQKNKDRSIFADFRKAQNEFETKQLKALGFSVDKDDIVPTQFSIIKHVVDSLKGDKRLSSFARMFLSSQWFNHPVIKSLFNIFKTSEERSNLLIAAFKQFYRDIENVKNPMFAKAVWDSDAQGKLLDNNTLKNKYKLTNDEINIYHQTKQFFDKMATEYFTALKNSVIYALSNTPEYANLSDNARKHLVEWIAQNSDSLRDNPIVIPKEFNIKEDETVNQFIGHALSKIKPFDDQINAYTAADKFYTPRLRQRGEWAIKVYQGVNEQYPDGTTKSYWAELHREHTPTTITQTGGHYQAAKIMKRLQTQYNGRIVDELPRNVKDNDIVIVKAKNPNNVSSLYEGTTNTAVQQYLEYMTERLKQEHPVDEKAIDKLISMIQSDIQNDFMSRGFATSRFIQRQENLVEGFEKNLPKVISTYLPAMSNSIARLTATSQLQAYLNSPDVRHQLQNDTQLFKYYNEYTGAMLKPASVLDKATATIKTFLTVRMLGMSLKSALSQLTQPFTVGLPEILGFMNAEADALRQYKPERTSGMDFVNANIKALSGLSQSSWSLLKNLMRLDTINPEEQNALDKILGTSVAANTFVSQIRNEASMILPSYLHSLFTSLMAPMQSMELASRKMGALMAYRLAKQKGLSNEDAINFGTKYNDNAFFIFSKVNKPLIALKNPIVSSMLTLRGYEVNYLGWLYKTIRNEQNKVYFDKLLANGLYTTLFGGALAVPFVTQILKAFQWITDDDKDTKQAFYKTLQKHVGQTGADVLTYGAPSLLGSDISTSLSVGLIPDDLSIPSLMNTLFGVWRGTSSDTEALYRAVQRGDFKNMFLGIAPPSLSKAVSAYSNYAENKPLLTKYGNVVTDVYGQPIKYTGSEAVLAGLGLRPIRPVKETEAKLAADTTKKLYDEQRNTIYDKLRWAPDENAIRQIITNDVTRYNQKAAKYGGVIPLITMNTIKQTLKRASGKPSKLGILLANADETD